MLLQNYVEMKWHGASKKHYIGMGYEFTKIGDTFKVHIIDVSKGSNYEILVECDYCGGITKKTICNYFKELKLSLRKDACSKCCNTKNLEINMLKYGVRSTQQIKEVRAKSINTMIERYGSKNPMRNDEVKEKLKNTFLKKYGVEHIFQKEEFKNKAKQTMLDRYGCEWYTQTEEYKEKSKQTCLEKYNVEYFLQTDEIQKMRTGENNPNWKGGFEYQHDKRNTPEYRVWRKSVFERDDYTCQKCGKRGHRLNAHHIHNYATNEELRFDESNGISLCEECHKDFHHINGYLNTNEKQLYEFIED